MSVLSIIVYLVGQIIPIRQCDFLVHLGVKLLDCLFDVIGVELVYGAYIFRL